MGYKELIVEIEKRFEILFTLSIFFAVLMTAYFEIVGGPEKDNHAAFVLFPVVGIYVGGYFVFQLVKLFPPLPLALKILNWILLFGVASFAMPIIFTIVARHPIPIYDYFSFQVDTITYKLSMDGITALPFIILFFTTAVFLLSALALISKEWAQKKIW